MCTEAKLANLSERQSSVVIWYISWNSVVVFFFAFRLHFLGRQLKWMIGVKEEEMKIDGLSSVVGAAGSDQVGIAKVPLGVSQKNRPLRLCICKLCLPSGELT